LLESLISSKTRVKLLLRFFLNPERVGYLRALATEFEESTNAVRVELNRLEGAGILTSSAHGNKKIFKTNELHPMFKEMQSLVRKHVGIDSLVEQVVARLGEVQKVYLAGALAKGLDSTEINIWVVGDVNESYLKTICEKAKILAKRNVSYQIALTESAITVAQEELLLVYNRNETQN